MVAEIGWIELLIGAVLGTLLGLIPAAYFYRRGQEHKVLDWWLLADTEIVPHQPDGLEVTWMGRPVERPRLVTFKVMNVGNRDVDGGDFQRHVTFELPETARLLGAYLLEVDPIDMLSGGVTVDQREHEAVFQLKLLKRGESFVVRALVDGPGRADVHARFAGQARPMWGRVERSLFDLYAGRALKAALATLVGTVGWLWLTRQPFVPEELRNGAGVGLLVVLAWGGWNLGYDLWELRRLRRDRHAERL